MDRHARVTWRPHHHHEAAHPSVAAEPCRNETGGVGSAWHRREGRLRSWWRHEQQSVAMALSAARHHSALEDDETY